MAAYGIEVQPGPEFTDRALVERAAEMDGVHFHWIEHLWDARSSLQRWRLLLGLSSYCRLARRLGKRILWTVHNHAGHEGVRWGDGFGFRTIARAADLIIVHSRWSGGHIRRMYRPAGEIACMPHGNFDGLYEPRRTPAEARAAYGLDDDRPVCGMIGGIRPYRGHELAIETVRQMGGRCQLLIAGHSLDERYRRRIMEIAACCPYIACHTGKLTDTQYAEMVCACDVILLPYWDITGSGALLSAWTLSRPVIMSDLPFFREFRPDDDAAGLIMGSRTSASLTECIGRMLTIPAAIRGAAARAEADKYHWHKVVKPVAEVLRRWGVG